MTLRLALTALFLLPPSALHAESPITITDHTVILKHTSTDPKDPANTSGYNLGPSIALLPDGRLMAVWFSSPSEGAESQRIVQAFSSDQGRTWGDATVLQDFSGKADFDPALFVAGTETFLFFSAFDPQIDIYFRRSGDSAKTWTEPVKINQKTGLTATSSASHLLCTRDGTLVLTYNPGPTPLRSPLLMRTSRDEGVTWSEPTLLADRPAKVGGWSICYPALTELPDGTIAAIWAQIKNSPGELYGDIHTARIVLKK